MNILVIGGGGREHALCWAISASPLCNKLYCAPASDAIARIAIKVDLAQDDLKGIVDFCQQQAIDLVVIGPELPLTLGLADLLNQNNIMVFGPSQKAARLEGSKSFAREFCKRHAIKGAEFASFTDLAAATDYITQKGAPIVIKADGLAAGKGVVVAETLDQALDAASKLMKFGTGKILIEEKLMGEEISFFALCDGKHGLPLMAVQDHKRAYDGDKGPNTGGMGTYAPPPMTNPSLEAQIMKELVQPTLDGMAQEGMPFQGVLFLGLMLTADGPRLIEYNVRFGDPECQVLMMLLYSDLLPALLAAAQGNLDQFHLRWQEGKSAICVVLAAKGYPEQLEALHPPIPNLEIIEGIASGDPDLEIFHAGTHYSQQDTPSQNKQWQANGGRVLNIVALGDTLEKARDKAYKLIDHLDWQAGFYRHDIGKAGLKPNES